MKNPYDKNGNLLKGAAKWTRTLKEDGGLESHDAKVAIEFFSSFINEHPIVAAAVASVSRAEKKSKLKVVR